LAAGFTIGAAQSRLGSPTRSSAVVITVAELKSDFPDRFNPLEDGWHQFKNKTGVIVEVQEDDNHQGLDLCRAEFAEKPTFLRAYELTPVFEDQVADSTVTVT
jgi:hypothetical protein